MSFDVFVSYSTKDAIPAKAACAALEAAKIRCWMAPRDIVPGARWGASIVHAINECRVMVLIFSGHANASAQVGREVDQAFSKAKTVVPLRIEDIKPADELAYYLDTVHWLDALTPPLERNLGKLVATVQALLPTTDPTPEGNERVFNDAEAARAQDAARAEDERRLKEAEGLQIAATARENEKREAAALRQAEEAEAQRRADEQRHREEQEKVRSEKVERFIVEEAERERSARGAQAKDAEWAARAESPVPSAAGVPFADTRKRGKLAALIFDGRAPRIVGVLLALQGVLQLGFYVLVWSDGVGSFSFDTSTLAGIWAIPTVISAAIVVGGAMSLKDVRLFRLIGVVASSINLMWCLIFLLPEGTLNSLSYAALELRQIINNQVGGIEDFAVNRSFTDWICTISALVSAVCVLVLLINWSPANSQWRTNSPTVDG
jgi:hypothetical protein